MSACSSRQAPAPHGGGKAPAPHGGGKNWDREHQALRDNIEKWGRLQFAGLFAGTSATDIYEMRTCPECGSTIHKVVDAARAAQLAAQQSEVVSRALDILSRGVLSTCRA